MFKFYLGLIFVVLPLIKFSGRDSFELPKIILFMLVSLLTFGISWFKKSFRNPKWTRLNILLLAYYLINLISSLVNNSFSLGWWGQEFRYQGMFTLLTMGILYWQISYNKSEISYLPKIIQFGLLINICYGWLTYLYGNHSRLSGNIGNPNFFGGYLALGLPYSAIWISPLVFLILLPTESKSALLGFAVTIGFMLTKVKSSIFWFVFGMMIGLAVLVFNRGGSHFDNRLVIWQKSILAFMDKPVVGWGRENFSKAFEAQLTDKDFDLKNIRVDKAHNEFMEIMVATGFVGWLIYILIISESFKILAKNLQQPLSKMAMISLITFLVISQFNVLNINEYVFLYTALGIASRQTT